MHMPFIKFALLGMLATLLLPAKGMCEFYQYEDDAGAIAFTDNPANIPKKQSKKKVKRADEGENAGSTVMPVKITGNRVVLPVTLNYRGTEVKANFVLDTGAEISTMTPEIAEQLSLHPDDTQIAIAQGIGTGYHVTRRTQMDYVLVGPNRKYNVDFLVIEGGGADGLLGMNFLRELRYHINFNKSVIQWGD